METLPGIAFPSPLLPFITVGLREEYVLGNRVFIGKVMAQQFPELFCLVKNPTPDAKDGLDFYKFGIVCTLEETDGKFMVKGKDRAKLSEVTHGKQKHWQVKFERLKDDPSHDEITPAHLPMMFGCIESIIRALSDWRKQLVSQQTESHPELMGLTKIIEKRLTALTHSRRERNTIYSLPWNLLADFADFFSLDFKIEMLATNKTIDRLQYTAESLISESSIFQYAHTISDLEGQIMPENNSTTIAGK